MTSAFLWNNNSTGKSCRCHIIIGFGFDAGGSEAVYDLRDIKLLAITLRVQPFETMYENALKIALNATGTK